MAPYSEKSAGSADRRGRSDERTHSFAVVIPARNEAVRLPRCLDTVVAERPDEIVVVDGLSDDDTAAIARDRGVRTLTADRACRGGQMNLGAAICSSDVLLFLCADSRLPTGALTFIDRVLDRDQPLVGGSLALRLHDDGSPGVPPEDPGRPGTPPGESLLMRTLAAGANLYCRGTRTLMCDRGIFVRRDAFARTGGFRELPVMEDVDFGRRLRRQGGVAVLARPAVSSSGRRLRGPGGALLAARVLAACLASSCGMSAENIARYLYAPRGGSVDRGSPPDAEGRSTASARGRSHRSRPALTRDAQRREDE